MSRRQIRMGFETVTEPVTEPVTVDELAEHVRRLPSEFDPELALLLIRGARKRAELETGVMLGEQQLRMTLDHFPLDGSDVPQEQRDEDGDCFVLIGWPVQEVQQLQYLELSGKVRELKTGDYRIDRTVRPARLEPLPERDWPKTQQAINAVTVTYTVGAPATATMKKAVLLMAGYWYEHQHEAAAGALAAIPLAAAAILNGN